MKRSIWKWSLGFSIAGLILLGLLTVGIWLMLNIGGALFLTLMGQTELSAISMPEMLANFVGSPMFWLCLADLLVLILSVIMLAVTKKEK